MSKHARYIKEHKLLISLVILLLVIFYFNYNLLKIIMAKETGAQNIPIVSPIASLIVSLVPPSHTDFREISKGDTAKKQVIITIDAGAGDKSAEGILTALSKRKIAFCSASSNASTFASLALLSKNLESRAKSGISSARQMRSNMD